MKINKIILNLWGIIWVIAGIILGISHIISWPIIVYIWAGTGSIDLVLKEK
jgi:hypothetical protein